MTSKKLPERPEFKEKTQVAHTNDIATPAKSKNPLVSHRLALSLGLTIMVMVISYFIISAKVQRAVSSVENAVMQGLGVSSQCMLKSPCPKPHPQIPQQLRRLKSPKKLKN